MNIIKFLKCRYVDVDELMARGLLVGKTVIYVNPFNYFSFRKNSIELDGLHFVFDGLFLSSLVGFTLLRSQEVRRQPFDFSGFACTLFSYCNAHALRVFVAGGNNKESLDFREKMKSKFQGIKFCGNIDGYRPDDEIISAIIVSKADVVVLGLGNIKQERVAAKLGQFGNSATIFTCGAFVSQTARSTSVFYYPRLINRFNLRWAYRFLKEPYIIKRVFLYYPAVVFTFFLDLLLYQFSSNK